MKTDTSQLILHPAETYYSNVALPLRTNIHAPRPVAMLVRTAQQYDADIMLECGGHHASAKSIMAILQLEPHPGDNLNISARGHDAEEAVHALEQLFACSFCV
jgi:phosphocarrier protein HPr